MHDWRLAIEDGGFLAVHLHPDGERYYPEFDGSSGFRLEEVLSIVRDHTPTPPTPEPRFGIGDQVRIVDLSGAPETIMADIRAAGFVGVVASYRRRADGEYTYRVNLTKPIGWGQLSFREFRLAPVDDLPTPAWT